MTVQLFLGDCLEILPTLEAGSVDAVVMDPPFNVGKDFANDNLDPLSFQAFCNRWVLELYRLQPINVLSEVGKNDEVLRGELGRYFEFRYHVCLNYTNSMRNGAVGYANWGLVLWFTNGGKVYHRYKDRLDSAVHNTKGEFEHPSPKEVDHYSRLCHMFAPDAGMVLDPFMGSGTTGVACVQTGRNFIGIEIDPGYFEIAKARIEKAQAEMVQRELAI
jgi:DNA modification methylase